MKCLIFLEIYCHYYHPSSAVYFKLGNALGSHTGVCMYNIKAVTTAGGGFSGPTAGYTKENVSPILSQAFRKVGLSLCSTLTVISRHHRRMMMRTS